MAKKKKGFTSNEKAVYYFELVRQHLNKGIEEFPANWMLKTETDKKEVKTIINSLIKSRNRVIKLIDKYKK